jgi:hypothetical protein
MSDTPLVDQFSEEEASGTKTVWELYTLARSLERERDDALLRLDQLEGAYEDATKYYSRMIDLIEEKDKLKDIIRRAKTAFFEDGPDGTICVNMLEILKEAKQ